MDKVLCAFNSLSLRVKVGIVINIGLILTTSRLREMSLFAWDLELNEISFSSFAIERVNQFGN